MNKETSNKAEATLAQANISARRAAAANQDPNSLKILISPSRLRSWSIGSNGSIDKCYALGSPTSPASPIFKWLETPGRDEGLFKAMEHVQFGW
ncbi:hypothetical protein BC936DRAFT_138197 [Jimgerdemannia flammicorona]|uniref:Uncharacterized protein n=2 Tax=Jimgerdemannia flammicorona TaxID=994334 RepID=A0A433PCV9_9FUNG|nr:hypothetical protein BC936DRAFT_138197 [Jimgerdemannia flammicorona]RUS15360.1 hypothetical protein BC938DRAFT_476980 [Jimgerdemannia flammicorona]